MGFEGFLFVVSEKEGVEASKHSKKQSRGGRGTKQKIIITTTTPTTHAATERDKNKTKQEKKEDEKIQFFLDVQSKTERKNGINEAKKHEDKAKGWVDRWMDGWMEFIAFCIYRSVSPYLHQPRTHSLLLLHRTDFSCDSCVVRWRHDVRSEGHPGSSFPPWQEDSFYT